MIDEEALARAASSDPVAAANAIAWHKHINSSETVSQGLCLDKDRLEQAAMANGRKLDFINVSKKNSAYLAEMELCQDCPIRKECLSLAIDSNESLGDITGVHGGYKAQDIQAGLVEMPPEMKWLIDHKILIRNYNIEN